MGFHHILLCQLAPPYLAFTYDGLRIVRTQSRLTSLYEFVFSYSQYSVAVCDLHENHPAAVEKLLYRGDFRASSASCGIRGLDIRTKRRPQHIVRNAVAVFLCPLYRKAGQTELRADGFEFRAWPYGKTHAGDASFHLPSSGYLAVKTHTNTFLQE